MRSRFGKNAGKRRPPLLLVFFAAAITLNELPQKMGTLNQEDPIPHQQKFCQATGKEEMPQEAGKEMGVQDLSKDKGGKDRVYDSTIAPEEEAKSLQEEQEKVDKSWEVLRNIIIDTRPR